MRVRATLTCRTLMLALLAISRICYASEPGNQVPCISIIIDDIGYRYHDDQAAIGLPGPVAYAIMPQSPHAAEMSQLADELGKLVLLHLPMEASDDFDNQFLGPGALTVGMSKQQFLQTLTSDLKSVPDAVGVNNHMGSLLTRYPQQMEWVMEALKKHNKFYVDSMTSRRSVAGTVAEFLQVPTLKRDVFLDNEQNEAYIRNQFRKLVEIARRRGSAVAIGHPRPDTIRVLQHQLRLLDEYGVRLVSLEELLRERHEEAPSAAFANNDSDVDTEVGAPPVQSPLLTSAHGLDSH